MANVVKNNTVASQCVHDHFFSPLCEQNGAIKKIMTVIFHVLTLGIPLLIYHLCYVSSSQFPKISLENSQQEVSPFSAKSVVDVKNKIDHVDLVVPQIQLKTEVQGEPLKGKFFILSDRGVSQVDDQGLLKTDQAHSMTSNSLKGRVAIYVSGTCNPAHKGHILLAEAAVRELAKVNIVVHDVIFSIAKGFYAQGKVEEAHEAAQKKNVVSKKFTLSTEQRVRILQWTVHEVCKDRGLFKGVERIFYWNDQWSADHPYAYEHLAQHYEKVYLAAGMDNCIKMGNWPTKVERAIVVKRRDGESPEKPTIQAPKGSERRYVDFPQEYEKDCGDLSSSAIQEQLNNKRLEPEALHAYFESCRPTAVV